MNILITGATGFVGSQIVKELSGQGHHLYILTRNVAKATLKLGREHTYSKWDSYNSIPNLDLFPDIDSVIHLSGENIANKRWSDKQKKVILDSRVLGTKNLLTALKNKKDEIKSFTSTSAIGFYGDRGNESMNENSDKGVGYLSDVCQAWEQAALEAKSFIENVSIIRVGVVLGKGGGALAKMLLPFKMGAGGPIGNGKQVMSWIHIKDLANLFIHLSTQTKSGIFNGVAPESVTNAEFGKTLAGVLRRPAFITTPAFAMKLLMGEMSDIVLHSTRVESKKVESEKGFNFSYPDLKSALEECCS